MRDTVNYDEIEHLRAHHPAWILLRAGNVSLVLSFLSRSFVEPNAADIPASELESALDDEIARSERRELRRLDEVSQRDRYQQFPQTARELLSDFRQVEENFRRLDRQLREQIAGWIEMSGSLPTTANYSPGSGSTRASRPRGDRLRRPR